MAAHIGDLRFENVNNNVADLCLLYRHFPIAFRRGEELFPVEEDTGLMAMGDTHYLDTWKAMEKLLKTGKVKAIGLSNFTQKEIQNIIDNSDTVSTRQAFFLHGSGWLGG